MGSLPLTPPRKPIACFHCATYVCDLTFYNYVIRSLHISDFQNDYYYPWFQREKTEAQQSEISYNLDVLQLISEEPDLNKAVPTQNVHSLLICNTAGGKWWPVGIYLSLWLGHLYINRKYRNLFDWSKANTVLFLWSQTTEWAEMGAVQGGFNERGELKRWMCLWGRGDVLETLDRAPPSRGAGGQT